MMRAEMQPFPADVADALELVGACWMDDTSDPDARTLHALLGELAGLVRTPRIGFDWEGWCYTNGICPQQRVWQAHCAADDGRAGACAHSAEWRMQRLTNRREDRVASHPTVSTTDHLLGPPCGSPTDSPADGDETPHRVGIARRRVWAPMLGHVVTGDAAYTLVLHSDGSVTWELGDPVKNDRGYEGG